MTEAAVLARPPELRFTPFMASFRRDSKEWPKWAQASGAALKLMPPALAHWRAADLVEFICTNGRAIYRLVRFDDRRGAWLLRREYEETV